MTSNQEIAVDTLKKVAALKEYFQGQCPGTSMQTDRDSDLYAWVFVFYIGSKVSHVLRISWQAIDDNPLAQLIANLEKPHWKAVLEKAGGSPIFFTSRGFQLPH